MIMSNKSNCRQLRQGSSIDRLNQRHSALVQKLRACLRECAVDTPPDRVARLTALAFQAEFPVGDGRNPLAHAIVRGILARRQLLTEEGGSVSTTEAAEKLGVSRRAVLERYRRGTIVGWFDENRRAIAYPIWQFKSGGLLPGIEAILQLFNEYAHVDDDMARVMFFLTRFGFLGDKRPLDCLRSGDIEGARRAALGFLE
jgi:hypothetical protein